MGKTNFDEIQVDSVKIAATNLTTTQQTGFIPLHLSIAREIVANDTDTRANNGGMLAKNTTPILERVNAATDQALRVTWAAGNADPITWSTPLPPDLDGTAAMTVKLRAKMAGATGALAQATSTLSRAIAAADVPDTSPAAGHLTVTLTPGAHATDAIHLFAVWLEYTRK